MKITLTQRPKPISIWLEPEKGKINPPMVIEKEPESSGRTFVHQPASEDRSTRLLGDKGSIDFPFSIPTSGRFRLWARVFYIDIDGNSWYCSIDDRKSEMLGNELQPLEQWHWIKGEAWDVNKGDHILHIKTREDGARLDQLLLTSFPDYVIHSVGLGIGSINTSKPAILFKSAVYFPDDSIYFMITPPSGFSLINNNLIAEIAVKDTKGIILINDTVNLNRELQIEMKNAEQGCYQIQARIKEPQNKLLNSVKEKFYIIPSVHNLYNQYKERQTIISALPSIEEWISEIDTGIITGIENIKEAGSKIYNAVQNLKSKNNPFQNKTGWITKAYISSIDNHREPYLLHIPDKYDPQKKYPLIIYLHGVTRGARHFRYMLEKLAHVKADTIEDAILLSLEGRCTMWYDHIAEEDMFSVIREVKECYPVDEDRIYLWGQSMGGYGTYRLACKYPHMWAALAPCAGGSITSLLNNLIHIPVNIFHGAKDILVPVEEAREAYRTLKKLEQEAYLTVYPDEGHQTDEIVVKKPKFWKWFLKYKRVRNPRHVVYHTYTLRHNKGYWVTIDAFSDYHSNTPACVDAVIRNKHCIEIKTKNIAKLTLNLNESLVDLNSPLKLIVNGCKQDNKEIKGKSISIDINPYPEKGLFKKHRLSGPFGDQYYDKFLIVYGTKENTEANREAALSYALWKSWESICDMRHVVRSEQEISVTDTINSHLIVFGTPQTSELLAKIRDKLPVEFNKNSIKVNSRIFEGKNIAVRFLYPNPMYQEKYLTVFGALTPQAYQSIPKWRANDMQFKNQPEIAVYDGKEHPVFSDFFDKNWNLTE